MKEAPCFYGLSFDPFSLFKDGLSAPEADVCKHKVLQALVATALVMMIDKGVDLSSEVAWHAVVFKEDAALQVLVLPLDLTLDLRIIRSATDVIHFLILGPFSQFA